MNIKERLFALSSVDAVGHITYAKDLAYDMLSNYCECEKTDTLTVIGRLKGESDYTLMLDAHIDQIAFVVTNVDDNGFLTVSNAGGIDLRMLPSRRVTVHGKEEITAVFCSTPPHLSTGDTEFSDIADIKIDTTLASKAKEIVSVGDYVTFNSEPCELLNTSVCGKSFDDRAGVAVLIEVAKRLKDKKLPINVAFVLSDGEELGLRGVRPAAFKVNPDEAIAVDVSFGDGIGITEEESGILGKGAMIGFSPCLDSSISKKLTIVAKEKEIPYQTEVMGRSTGTNADMISVNRGGVRTCTLSVPLRNMHTDCEILNINDLENTVELLCEYILGGGIK